MRTGLAEVLFGSRLRARALAWLFSHPDEEFYISRVAAATGEPASNLSVELQRLAEAGILESRREGVQKYFRANRRLAVFAELCGIAAKTAGVADAVREALGGLAGVDVAFVYGSVASGAASAESDVDVMVVGQAKFADVVGALEGLRERLAREVSPRVYSAAEFRRKAASGSGFFAEVLKNDKIFVAGSEAEMKRIVRGK